MPIRTAKETSSENTNPGAEVENGSLTHCWWKYKMVPSLRKTVWHFLKKKYP